MNTQPLSRISIFQYGLLALPIAFAGMPLYIHAPDYYSTHFGAPLAALGIILLVLRLVDAFQDPLIGRLSDRFHRKRPIIMTAAAGVLIISFMALFLPLWGHALWWFAICMFLATSAFSVLSINLNSLGGLWSRDSFQKTRITTTREGFGVIGLLLSILLPGVFMLYLSAPAAFMQVSIILAILMSAGIILFIYWYWQHAETFERKKITSQQLFVISPHTYRFFLVYATSMLASSMPAILVLFFIRDLLGVEHLTAMFLALYFIPGALGMFLWQVVSKYYGKYKAWMFAMLLAVISFVWAFLLGEGDIWQFAVICIFSGIAFGADLALPPSILADHIHHFEMEENASFQFSLLTFLAKSALAIASVIVLPLLDSVGFRPGQLNNTEALYMLSLSYAAIPCFIKSVAIGLLWYNHKHYGAVENYAKQISHLSNRSRNHA